MKVKKIKAISVAICCAVTALCTEIQGMEQRRDEPTGGIISFAGEVAPNGWLLCDGQQFSNQRYPELYEVVREKYVPGGSWVIEENRRSQLEKYFCVPDLIGRVIVGIYGGSWRVTANNTLGASGGIENAIDEMPIHDHKINLCSGSNRIHSVMNQYGGTLMNDGIIESSGGRQTHNNMQPYQVLNYIINTGEMNRKEKYVPVNIGIFEHL